MVRLATRADIPRLIELGEEFAMLSQPYHGFTIDRTRIIEFTNEVVDNEQAVVLVLDNETEGVIGVLAGIITPVFFSTQVILQELVWYVRGKNKGGLEMMRQYEIMAVLKGVDRLVVGCKPKFLELENVYNRLGYELLETQYVKNLRS